MINDIFVIIFVIYTIEKLIYVVKASNKKRIGKNDENFVING